MSQETMMENCTTFNQRRVTTRDTSDLIRDCIKSNMSKYFDQINAHSSTGLHQLVMQEVEKPLLECVMQHTQKNQSKAAQVLGISRSTLRKKLDHYDL